MHRSILRLSVALVCGLSLLPAAPAWPEQLKPCELDGPYLLKLFGPAHEDLGKMALHFDCQSEVVTITSSIDVDLEAAPYTLNLTTGQVEIPGPPRLMLTAVSNGKLLTLRGTTIDGGTFTAFGMKRAALNDLIATLRRDQPNHPGIKHRDWVAGLTLEKTLDFWYQYMQWKTQQGSSIFKER